MVTKIDNNGIVNFDSISTEEDLKQGPRININPPPAKMAHQKRPSLWQQMITTYQQHRAIAFSQLALLALVLMSSPCLATVSIDVNDSGIVDILITPEDETIAAGSTMQFSAVAVFDDDSTQDITNSMELTWESSDEATATVSNGLLDKGLVTGVSDGEITISATYNGMTGSTDLTVETATLVEIEITPEDPEFELEGQGGGGPGGNRSTIQFTAIGIYDTDLEQDITELVTWESSDEDVATISNIGLLGDVGEATALEEGTTTISATLGDISGSTELTVVIP